MALSNNSNIKLDELREMHPDLTQWALFCTRYNPDLAKDVLQQSYLKIVEGTAVFKKQSTLKTWMYSVVRLTSLEQQRKVKLHSVDCDAQPVEEEPELDISDSTFTDLYTKEAIEEAINQLSLMQREIIFLAFYKEYSLSEIAKILGVGVGSIRTQYHRAKVKLKILLIENPTKEVIYEKQYP